MEYGLAPTDKKLINRIGYKGGMCTWLEVEESTQVSQCCTAAAHECLVSSSTGTDRSERLHERVCGEGIDMSDGGG